jgi:hypothetical protein
MRGPPHRERRLIIRADIIAHITACVSTDADTVCRHGCLHRVPQSLIHSQ